MGQIRQLPPALINKIAAGEVIERPASVVKELLENSLDAGAERIDLVVTDGGRQLIRLADDGSGIAPEDMKLALSAHATSKLDDEGTLFSINTLGFRGEALASIAAVSQLTLTSRQAHSQEAYTISSHAGEIEGPVPTSGPVGTTVEVKNLFFNMPARRKFLRTHTTEFGHVSEQLTRVALAQPQTYFTLMHNTKSTYDLPPVTNWVERTAVLFGPEMANSLLEIHSDQSRRTGIRIDGWVGMPATARSSANWQYFFLNGRYIRDRFIGHAVREAYRGLLEPSRYPVAFLFTQIPADQVDVNVHPTKIEVRWRDSHAIHSQVLAALRDKFLRSDLSSQLRASTTQMLGGGSGGKQGSLSENEEQRRHQLRTAMADFFKQSPPPASGSLPFTRQQRTTQTQRWPAAGSQEIPVTGAGAAASETATPRRGGVLQVHNCYLVAETEEGIIIVDQHALHERVMYEQLRERLTEGPLEAQQLLVPVTIELSDAQQALLDEHTELLGKLGIEISSFGTRTVAVQSFPTLLKGLDPSEFIMGMLDQAQQDGRKLHPELLLEQLLSMMACKAAVKFGDHLTPEELDSLLDQRDRVERSSNCPHGRPTTLRLTLADLQKQFKRT